jgi:hypothetical protein
LSGSKTYTQPNGTQIQPPLFTRLPAPFPRKGECTQKILILPLFPRSDISHLSRFRKSILQLSNLFHFCAR